MTHITHLAVVIANSDYLTTNTDSVSGWYERKIKSVLDECRSIQFYSWIFGRRC